MTNELEFTDRYAALGIPLPDVETMCAGQCEGIGTYPQKNDEFDSDGERQSWQTAHDEAHTLKSAITVIWKVKQFWLWKSIIKDVLTGKHFKCDGWHFIKCAGCSGTGKAK